MLPYKSGESKIYVKMDKTFQVKSPIKKKITLRKKRISGRIPYNIRGGQNYTISNLSKTLKII
jgi:hypothetical protein